MILRIGNHAFSFRIMRNKGNLFVFLFPLVLFILPIIQGKVLFWGTAGLQFVPWRQYAYQLLDQGILPLWNPLNGMGAPLLANYQSALFYPPSWVLYPLYRFFGAEGIAIGYTLLIPLHLGWAGVGMMALLDTFGVNKRGQVISGMAFSFCGYFLARGNFFSMIWAGSWFPWLLWSIEYFLKKSEGHNRINTVLPLVMISSMQLLAGHAQLTWYSMLFSGLWLLVRIFSSRPFKSKFAFILLNFFLGLLFGVLLSLVQLLPTLEYLLQSQRADLYNYSSAMVYSFWPWHLMGFLLPDLFGNPGLGNYWGYGAFWEDAIYIGVMPFLMGITSIKFAIKWNKDRFRETTIEQYLVRFLWIISIIGFLFALGDNTPLFPWLYKHIPSFDMFQAPARFMLWPVFSLCFLAGIQAGAWSRPVGKVRKRIKLLIPVGIGIMVAAGAGLIFLPNINRTISWAFLILGFFCSFYAILALFTPGSTLKPRQGLFWNSMVMFTFLADLALAGYGVNPFTDSKFFEDRNQSEQLSTYAAEDSFARYFLPSDVEYDLKFERFLKFDSFLTNENWTEMRNFLIPNLNLLDGISLVNNFDPLVPKRFSVWLEKLGELSWSDQEKILGAANVKAVIRSDQDGNLVIDPISQENIKNRFQWYSCATVANLEQNVLDLTFERLATTKSPCIIVESNSKLTTTSYQNSAPRIGNVVDNVNEIVVQVNTPENGWLEITDIGYPGWTVLIDGEKAQLLKADFIFRSVFVPKGDHLIQILYQPWTFTVGAWISGMGWIILLGWIFLKKTDS